MVFCIGVTNHVNGNFSIIKNKVISLGVGDVEQKSALLALLGLPGGLGIVPAGAGQVLAGLFFS